MNRHAQWMGRVLAVTTAGLTMGLLATGTSALDIRDDVQELRPDRREIRGDSHEIRGNRRELLGDTREIRHDRRALRRDVADRRGR